MMPLFLFKRLIVYNRKHGINSIKRSFSISLERKDLLNGHGQSSK